LNLIRAVSKVSSEFEEIGYNFSKFKETIGEIDTAHGFIKNLFADLQRYENLKNDIRFDSSILEDKRGWLINHTFSITLEILNREKVPGKDVYVPATGEKKSLLIYYGLCPELENFMTLIVWTNTKSSMNVWKQILSLLEEKDEKKVLSFSPKCGIRLPNEIHPSRDFDAKLVSKEYFESLYDWKYNPFLFDDGITVYSHNSPINYRKIFLDEYTQEEAFVGIRTTIGRVLKIFPNKVLAMIPTIYGKPQIREFFISGPNINWKSIKSGNLYFFLIFRMTGAENIELHIRKMEDATACDILGMLLAYACYLIYLNSSRLKLCKPREFQELFIQLYQQVSMFCHKSKEQMSTIENIDWIKIQPGYSSTITRWIGNELFYIPPILRQYFSEIQPQTRDFLVLEFDKALAEKKSKCFEKIPFTETGNRRFNLAQMGKYNSLYNFIHFILENKKLILEIDAGRLVHEREREYDWLDSFIKQIHNAS